MQEQDKPVKLQHSVPVINSSLNSASVASRSDKNLPDHVGRFTLYTGQKLEKTVSATPFRTVDRNEKKYYANYDPNETEIKELTRTRIVKSDGNGDKPVMLSDYENNTDLKAHGTNSTCSLDSKIKVFRTTIQDIFENFFSSVEDLENYKMRFNAILNKNQQDCLEEMDNFIKEIIHSILSGTTVTNLSRKIINDRSDFNTSSGDFVKTSDLETKNISDDRQTSDEQLFDFMFENKSITSEMRNLLSEIQIRTVLENHDRVVASTDDFKKILIKRKEIDDYIHHDTKISETEIPVKMSNAKNDIRLQEVENQTKQINRSFLCKLCGYFCRRFRKNV